MVVSLPRIYTDEEVDKYHKLAFETSHEIHKNDKRNDKTTPYTVHTDGVANTVEVHIDLTSIPLRWWKTVLCIAKCVGYLHDTIEDHKEITEEYLLKLGFPLEIVQRVKLMAKVKDTSYLAYLLVVKQDFICKAVKLADIAWNSNDGIKIHGNQYSKYELAAYILRS